MDRNFSGKVDYRIFDLTFMKFPPVVPPNVFHYFKGIVLKHLTLLYTLSFVHPWLEGLDPIGDCYKKYIKNKQLISV